MNVRLLCRYLFDTFEVTSYLVGVALKVRSDFYAYRQFWRVCGTRSIHKWE